MPTTISSQQPYKHLAYFDTQDADLFFGRERETKELLNRLENNRIILLYGVSGTGKTSLLLAGLSSVLKQDKTKQEIIYVRVTEDPTLTIQRILNDKLSQHGNAQQATTASTDDNLNSLRQNMVAAYSESELRNLCLALNVDYGQLTGESPHDKVRELILLCQRHGSLPQLLQQLQNERPNLSWFQNLRIVENQIVTQTGNGTSTDSLGQMFRSAARHLDTSFVIILDQFERFFTQLDPVKRSHVVASLTEIYEENDLPVKIILSLREDQLARTLDEFKAIPDLFNARYYLSPLNLEQAREAIEMPLKNISIACEEDLIQQLLSDLTSEEISNLDPQAMIMPMQLQLICYMLVAILPAGQKQLTLADYQSNKIGGMQGILSRFLQEQVKGLLPEEKMATDIILQTLVSSTNTKRVATFAELVTAVNQEPEPVQQLLEKLTNRQLIRPLEMDQATGYELVHEYLAQEIRLSEELKIQKAIAELVRQEVQNWRNLDTLIGPDKLKIISPWYDQNKENLTSQQIALIEKSLAQKERDYAEYLNIVENDNLRKRLVSAIGNMITSPVSGIKCDNDILLEILDEIKEAISTYSPDDDLDFDEGINLQLTDITEIAEVTKEAAEHMTQLLDVLGNFAESQKFKPLNLGYIVESSLLLLEHDTRNIQVKKRLPKNLIVNGSSSQLMQLFVNLIDNCINAILENPDTRKPLIEITLRQTQSEIVTIIVHNGKPVDPELSEAIFDFDLEQNSLVKNQGFNLSIAKQIVVRHQGTINMPKASKPGKTAFKVVLPAYYGDDVT